MKVSFRADGLAVEEGPALELVDSTLRGVGQVMFQSNTYAGLLFTAGVLAASPTGGAAMLLGALVSTLVAAELGADRDGVRAGLFGFNGALVGVALAVFLRPDTTFWAAVVVGAAASTVVTAALARLSGSSGVPGLTAPFVLVTWAALAARAQLTELSPSDAAAAPRLIATAAGAAALGPQALAEGVVRGVAQVFVQAELVSGGLIFAGLAVASRQAAVVTALGSACGLFTAWALGAPGAALRSGLFGYNSALTALALVTFLGAGARVSAYALVGAIATAVASATAAAATAPLGVPALTAAFVVVTWAFLLAAPRFAALAASGDSDA
ncbi:MAG: urea transporter [Polyangiaceae bacterium]|nr:urea transporter [Polyangiaceae bacterium]